MIRAEIIEVMSLDYSVISDYFFMIYLNSELPENYTFHFLLNLTI